MTRSAKIQILAALLAALPLAACGGGAEKPAEGEHGAAAQPEKGPHNGRMLRNGDFALEMTVFEDGVPPLFRVFPTRGGKPLDPKLVDLTVTLHRLDGEVNVFKFKPVADRLDGQGTVVEPHSFDFEVVALVDGKRHVWKYANPEGQTRIPVDVAKANGVIIETAGPATIGESRELFGSMASPAHGWSLKQKMRQFPTMSELKMRGDGLTPSSHHGALAVAGIEKIRAGKVARHSSQRQESDKQDK